MSVYFVVIFVGVVYVVTKSDSFGLKKELVSKRRYFSSNLYSSEHTVPGIPGVVYSIRLQSNTNPRDQLQFVLTKKTLLSLLDLK